MSSSNGYKVTHIDLGPEMAADLLSRNLANRPIKRHAVTRYARDITAGRWHDAGDSIRTDTNGHLLDGQNRCLAVIEASEQLGEPISIPVLLIEGLPAHTQDVMDSGAGRTVGDQLARRHVVQYAKTAAAVRSAVLFLTEDTNISITKAQQLQFWTEHAEQFKTAVEATSDHINTSGINTSAISAAHFVLNSISPDAQAVEEFINAVVTGENLQPGSAVLALRGRFQGVKLKRETVTNYSALIALLRTWNAWRKGTPLAKFPLRGKVNPLGVKDILP